MRWIARALLANQHGGPLAQLAIVPRQPPLQRTLGAIVVHTAIIFQSRQGVELLEPFVKMLNNPAALMVGIHNHGSITIFTELPLLLCVSFDYLRMPTYQPCPKMTSLKPTECLVVEGLSMVSNFIQ